jgi:hypothetical protein
MILGAASYALVSKFNSKKRHHDFVESLKNALLSFALAKVYREKFDDFNMEYRSFDGSTLPMMSGCSITNACFTYIQDKEMLRKNVFYTQHMENKIEAIEKFIHTHFDSTESVIDFFETFIKADDSNSSDKQDDSQCCCDDDSEDCEIVDHED